ncbi:MAG: ATP-dependent helicase [Candidatus Kapabacteria bacterium]|nr:ATP-dependent helicase [Candidatus Kapabacteria bacterium]MDW8012533.1 ATP-dependent helicase [Bacteroidota bacterium]
MASEKVIRILRTPTGHRPYRLPYEKELNPAQLQAVMHQEGAALVIAGAGTGKTRTLVYRVARLVEDGVPPESILLLTFTRKAAREMLHRAARLLDGRCERVSGGTFHSFANAILRRYGDVLGLPSNFTILDQTDAQDVLNLLRSELLREQRRERFPQKQTLYDIHSAAINRCRSVEDILRTDYPHFQHLAEELERLFAAYSRYKRQHGLVDYDDLLLLLIELLEHHPGILRRLHAQFRYVMVDEYQDTNPLQHRISLLLAGPEENILAVGDDTQSIYSFRGADFRNILEFPKAFRQCTYIRLEENYRSTQPILNLANAIIARAAYGYRKQLYSRQTDGPLPAVIRAEDEHQQSLFVAQKVLELREQGLPLSEIAVLARSSHLFFDLELELARAGIPFRKFGGLKFTETAHVKDVLALIRIVDNIADVVSWHRVLLLLEGVGPRTARRIVDAIRQGLLRWEDAHCMDAILPGTPTVARTAVLQLWEALRGLFLRHDPLPELLHQAALLYRPLLQRHYDDHHKRWKDIEALIALAARYQELRDFLADIAIEPPTESVAEAKPPGSDEEAPLTLSTVHSAKGLEWSAVFILWMTDGCFPVTWAYDSLDAYEEERRLFYVACTRAKRYLYILYPTRALDRESGWVLSKPSPFLAELQDGLVERWILVTEDSLGKG